MSNVIKFGKRQPEQQEQKQEFTTVTVTYRKEDLDWLLSLNPDYPVPVEVLLEALPRIIQGATGGSLAVSYNLITPCTLPAEVVPTTEQEPE